MADKFGDLFGQTSGIPPWSSGEARIAQRARRALVLRRFVSWCLVFIALVIYAAIRIDTFLDDADASEFGRVGTFLVAGFIFFGFGGVVLWLRLRSTLEDLDMVAEEAVRRRRARRST